MSRTKLWILAVVCSLVCSSWGRAQNLPSPQFAPKDVQLAENTRPLAEPGIFNYDAQMFAPVEFSNFSNPDPNTGFFASYDRTSTSVSRGGVRPLLAPGVFSSDFPRGNDFMSGNRYEIGWMTEADDGWSIVYSKTEGGFFAHGQDILISNPMLVRTNLSTVGINRIFRQSTSHGGYFEPYIGIRYSSLSDKTLEDTVITIGATVINNRFKQSATNSMIGPQVGSRYNLRAGRFRYTMEGAVSAMYNQQRYFASDILITDTTIGVSEFYDSDSSFVPSVDLRMEMVYHITRDVGIRASAGFAYLWDGMNRSNNLTTAFNPNSLNGVGGGVPGIFNEGTTAAGFGLGFEWNH